MACVTSAYNIGDDEEEKPVPVERLLVIDDSKETRDFLEEFLGSQGYTVLTARDGEEGLLRALNENPDVILLDMQLPTMTGVEVIEALNLEGRDIPVIFMTAYGSEDLVVRAFRLGARDYVPKPYEPQVVLDSVERVLNKVRLRRERDHLTDQLSQANQTLQTQLQELNALYNIGKSVTSSLDVEPILVRVVEAAAFLTQADECSLMLLDESSDALYLRAAKSADENTARRMRIRVDDTLARRVISAGRPVILAGEQLRRVTTAHAAKALLMVPLHTLNRGDFGVLLVSNTASEHVFDEHDLHLLSAIVNSAAGAIDSAMLVANLYTEKNSLETVLQEAREAVLVVDEQSCIVFCNRSARRVFELGENNILGCSVQDVIANQELVDLLARYKRSSSPQRTEVSLIDGRTLNASINAIDGVGYAIVMLDITHLKELDRIKSEYVLAVAHDLRTPLTAIQGYVDMLSLVGPLTERQQQFVDRVQSSLSSITQLVSDLLDISRIETVIDLEMDVTELKPLISDAISELQSDAEVKEQSLQLFMPDTLSPIQGNPHRLRQMVVNLVSNAIKYTPSGGKIVVEATEGEDHITISVADNGFGIPLGDQSRVFDKFFRADLPESRDIPGTGLGLSIVKSVVEKHGGRVWVESALGEGSTFTVLLPKG